MTIPVRLGGAIVALILGITDAAGVPVEPGVSQVLARSRADLLSGLNYRLHFDIPAEPADAIRASATVSFDLKKVDGDLQLDFRAPQEHLLALRVNDTTIPHRLRKEHIVLPAAALLAGGNRVEIEFLAGSGSLNRNPDYLYTLFVPDRARTAFPLFDQPDLKATWDLTLALPAGWQAVANAPLLETVVADGRTEHRFARSALISSYLFSFVAGRFERITREVDGRAMTLYHRETDSDKVARNLDALFELHGRSLAWLEEFTGIDYPFGKFDFVLIPDFQYAGMEHPGAVLYRASRLLLESAPAEHELLRRAQLIAHESAHMWFGNLVTMRWFDDVWTKEVFANFMAGKIANPAFPDIDHGLAFHVTHYPKAYRIDRSAGANPIRQPLPNLNEAGQLYGEIIYNKAPIMMRQLELLTGSDAFRTGLRDYLQRFAFANASWAELVKLLDRSSEAALEPWSAVWVDTPGRPRFAVTADSAQSPGAGALEQRDDAGLGRLWPQRFSVATPPFTAGHSWPVASTGRSVPLPGSATGAGPVLFNADGYGYGLFPADPALFEHWRRLPAVARAALLVNAYENLLDGTFAGPQAYLRSLLGILGEEEEELLLQLALAQLAHVYDQLLPAAARVSEQAALESALWQGVVERADDSTRKLFFRHFSALAGSPAAIERLLAVWSARLQVPGVALDEEELITLAEILAIRLPDRAAALVQEQAGRTANPDSRRRLEFIAPALSADPTVRDAFFDSLATEANRHTEAWVLDALGYLHHPTRIAHAERYLLPTLQLLPEIQATGDIFFPGRWLQASLERHHSPRAARVVRRFLADHPDYNHHLRTKILQSADALFRACGIRSGEDC